MARDVRLNLEGAEPVLGIAAASAALDTVKGVPRFVPQGWGVASSRDLAYTYGVLELKRDAGPDTTVYVHVWRRAPARWELALAVLNPVRR